MPEHISFDKSHLELLESTDGKSWIIVQGFGSDKKNRAEALFRQLSKENPYCGYRLASYGPHPNSPNTFVEKIIKEHTPEKKSITTSASSSFKKPNPRKTIPPSPANRRMVGALLLSLIFAGALTLSGTIFIQGLLTGILSPEIQRTIEILFFLFTSIAITHAIEKRYSYRNDFTKTGPFWSICRILFSFLADQKSRSDEKNMESTDKKNNFSNILQFLNGQKLVEPENVHSEQIKEKQKSLLSSLKEAESLQKTEENTFGDLQASSYKKKSLLSEKTPLAQEILETLGTSLYGYFVQNNEKKFPETLFISALTNLFKGVLSQIFENQLNEKETNTFIHDALQSIFTDIPPETPKNKKQERKTQTLTDQGMFLSDHYTKNQNTFTTLITEETYSLLQQWMDYQSSFSNIKNRKERYVVVLHPYEIEHGSDNWSNLRGIIAEVLFYLYSEGFLYEETPDGFILVFYDPTVAINALYGIYEFYIEESVQEMDLTNPTNSFFQAFLIFWPSEIETPAELIRETLHPPPPLSKNQFALDTTTATNLKQVGSLKSLSISLPGSLSQRWYSFDLIIPQEHATSPIQEE